MKKFLIKAVLPVSMVVCAVAVASCSQDELLTQTKEQSEESVLSNPREIRNYLKTLPLAPMMTRANGPITPDMVLLYLLRRKTRSLRHRVFSMEYLVIG